LIRSIKSNLGQNLNQIWMGSFADLLQAPQIVESLTSSLALLALVLMTSSGGGSGGGGGCNNRQGGGRFGAGASVGGGLSSTSP
jgi:hypothetical protein